MTMYSLSLVYVGHCNVTVRDVNKTLSGRMQMFEATNLTLFNEYQFTITAINQAGSSPPAVSIFSTVPAGTCKWSVQIGRLLYVLKD